MTTKTAENTPGQSRATPGPPPAEDQPDFTAFERVWRRLVDGHVFETAGDPRPGQGTLSYRGFPVYTDFIDDHESWVTVQMSSAAEKLCAYVYITNAELGSASAHLTREQATWVRDALTDFLVMTAPAEEEGE